MEKKSKTLKRLVSDSEKPEEAILEIEKFLVSSGRSVNDINKFIFKVQKIFTNLINTKEYYINIDHEYNINKKKEIISNMQLSKENVKYKIDIRSANFSILKLLSDDIDKNLTWENYFRKIYPADIRTERLHNIKNNTNGITTLLPDVIYKSKYMRIFVLANLEKLSSSWELLITELAEKIHKINNSIVRIGSDEIFLSENIPDGIVLPDYYRIIDIQNN